jgi:hypothetical protein
MLIMYFLSLKLVVFVVYLSVYVGNALLNFKASSFIVYLSVYVGNVLLIFKAHYQHTQTDKQ